MLTNALDEISTRKTAVQLEMELSRNGFAMCESCAIGKAQQRNVPKESSGEKAITFNVKPYLINYPHLSDYGQTIFCLSIPSRDRATAPGRYEQFYFTKHVPYPQK